MAFWGSSAPAADIRQQFVFEYLRDYNPLNAVLRCGVDFSFAQRTADDLMRDPWVNSAIVSSKTELPVNSEEQIQKDQMLVLATLRQLMLTAGHTNRATAAGLMANILQLGKGGGGSGVAHHVMEVPIIPEGTAWEDLAQSSQGSLRERTMRYG